MAINSFISSAVSAVGGTIGSFAVGLANIISDPIIVLNPFKIAEVIVEIIKAIGESLGIINPDDKLEELGAKATQEGVKSSADFESTEAYIEYLRDEIKLDRYRLNQMSSEEKLICQITGASILTKGIEEKLDMKLSPEFLVCVAKMDMRHREIKSYIDSFKASGINDMQVMVDYLTGKGTVEKIDIAKQSITGAIADINPDMTIGQISEKLYQMKQEASK